MDLPDFKYDVVVGSHPDDDLPIGEIHWVTRFYSDLRNFLAQMIDSPRVHSLRHGEGAAGVIDESDRILRDSATLVAVLGRKAVAYGEHWSRFAARLDLSRPGPTRLFKAYKTACGHEPGEDDAPGYNFWSSDPVTDRPFELLYENESSANTKHLKEVYRLACDVDYTLRYMAERADTRPRVYLAGNTPETLSFHKEVHAFLNSWCHVCTEPLFDPDDSEAFKAAVRGELEKCVLSIHLLGNGLPSRDFEANSVSGMQAIIARELVERRRLAAIIWAPEQSDRLVAGPIREFPENFENLCSETLSGLKARIRARLAQPLPRGQKTTIFVIAHQDDLSRYDVLKNLGAGADKFEVLYSPPFDPTRYQISDYRKDLDRSDAAVICWADAPEPWFTRMQDSLLAHLGQNCNLSLKRYAVYFKAPRTSFYTPFERIPVKSFEAGQLRIFLDSMRGEKGKGQAR
jgi:hypothetical protein